VKRLSVTDAKLKSISILASQNVDMVAEKLLCLKLGKLPSFTRRPFRALG